MLLMAYSDLCFISLTALGNIIPSCISDYTHSSLDRISVEHCYLESDELCFSLKLDWFQDPMPF